MNTSKGNLCRAGLIILVAIFVSNWRVAAQVPVNGHALKFDGQNDFVRVLSNPIPTNGSFTVECWVNAATPAAFGFRTIISQAVGSSFPYPRFYLGLDPGGQIRAGDAWAATGVTLPLEAWHHLALVRSSTNTFLYLDGALRATSGSALPNPTSAPWMDIGQQFDDIEEFWNGGIDEVRIWKTARTAAQITANASKRLAGSESGLVAYYRFDSATGTIATNSASSGSVHKGFLTNGPAWFGLRVVTNKNDSGAGSLRQTIADAQSGDYIVFATNLSGSTILLTNSQLSLNGSFNIDASMLPRGLSIDGNGTFRCLGTGGGVTNVLTGLTFTNGFVAAGGGGGIFNYGQMTLNRCAIVGNIARGDYPWGCGGGIYNWGDILTLNQCTITENSVQDSGGGVFNYVGTVRADHCTFIANSSGDDIFGGGGGLINYSGSMTVSNTISCNNSAPANVDVGGSFTGAGNFIGGSPLLDQYGMHGGSTPTIPPLPGSPVIDAAVGSHFETDQRGLPRNLDGDGNGSNLSDIGATEFQASSVVSTWSDTGEGSLRAAIASSPGGSSITFGSSLSGRTITLSSGQLVLDKNLNIDGGENLPRGVTIDGGHSSRVFQVGGGATVKLYSLTIANGVDIGAGNDGGGGILNYGDLTLYHCTVTGNSSTHGGWGGGGILTYNGSLTINQSTLVGNSTSSQGGGIIAYGVAVNINQSTLVGNSAGGFGGGIAAGQILVTNSILALNTAPSSPDFSAVLTGENNFTSGNPGLAPFGNYGGPTPTMPPLPGSPVIDAAATSIFPWDQRGFVRSVDGDTNGTALPDIGATEFIPFNPTRGNYAGLFGESSGARHVSAGYFSAQVTGGRAYTAKIWLAGKSYSFSGKFDLLGQSIKTISRKSLPTVTVKLYSLAPDQLYGIVTDGTWTSDLNVDRLVFNSKTNRAPAAGKYTFRIRSGAPGTVILKAMRPSRPDPDSMNVPAGDGFGSVTISTGGGIAFAGTLADGTKVSQGTLLSAGNQWPFYLSPYSGGGSVIGWENVETITPRSIAGEVLWTKVANAAAKYYPLGFTNRCGADGSQYVAPAKGTRIIDMRTSGAIGFSYGGISRFSNFFLLGTNNKIANLSSNKLTLSFTLSSGIFNGSVVDPATFKPISFRGAVFQNENQGCGFFLHTNLSGLVIF